MLRETLSDITSEQYKMQSIVTPDHVTSKLHCQSFKLRLVISVNLRERLLNLMTRLSKHEITFPINQGSSDLLGELLAAFEHEISSQTTDESHDKLSSLSDPSQMGQTVQHHPDQTGVHHKITLQRETGMFMMLWACRISVTWLCVTGPVWEPSPELCGNNHWASSPDWSCCLHLLSSATTSRESPRQCLHHCNTQHKATGKYSRNAIKMKFKKVHLNKTNRIKILKNVLIYYKIKMSISFIYLFFHLLKYDWMSHKKLQIVHVKIKLN